MKKTTWVLTVMFAFIAGINTYGYNSNNYKDRYAEKTFSPDLFLMKYWQETYFAIQTADSMEEAPIAPVAEDQSFCGETVVSDIIVTGESEAVFKWYTSETGGTALSDTEEITESGTYYVSQTVSGEESERTVVEITINSVPEAPTASAQAFCGSATVGDLEAEGEDGASLSWYASATGGTALSDTEEIAESGTYYVSQTVDGCESERTSVEISINTIPEAPTASAQLFCGTSTVADLVAEGETGADFNWYDSEDSDEVLEETEELSNGLYYVSQTVDGCESERTGVFVSISLESTVGTGTSTQIYPLGNHYGYERSAALYTSDEIGLTGGVSSVSWEANVGGNGSRPIKVYLKETEEEDLSAGTSWEDIVEDALLVYDAGMEPVQGWNEFALTSTFVYSGGANLLVLVEANYGGFGNGGGSGGNQIKYSTATNKHRWWRSDSSAPTSNGTLSDNRPNIKFSFGQASCSLPTDLSIEGVTSDSTSISWEEADAEPGEYMLYISEENIAPSFCDVTDITTTETAFVFEELEANIKYYIWIRSACGNEGGMSPWLGPLAVQTLCESIPVPFSEGFNTDSQSLDCWTILDLNNDGTDWGSQFVTDDWTFYEGNQSMYYNNYGEDHDDWLISPTFEGNGDYRVRFYYRSTSYDNAFSVLMSTDGVNTEDFTEVLPSTSMTKGEGWKEKTFYVTDITDQFYIAFYAGTAQSTSAKSFYIDHFRIDNVPDCPEPYEVQIVEATQTSLEVEWLQYGDSSTWEVIILPASEEFPADESELNIIEVEGEPNVIFEDLDPATMYKIYVRTVCTEESEWTNPVQEGTLPTNDECVDAINIPVNEGAECEEFVSGTIAGATLSEGYETPDCIWDNPTMDVWFEFTATEELLEVSFDNFSSASTTSPSIYVAVYQGECDELEEIYCENVGSWNTTYFRLEDLEIGETYYIRVLNDWEVVDVFFDICITTPLPPIRTSESGDEYTVEELVKDILITAPCDLVSNISYRTGTDFVEIPWWGGEPEVQANGIGYFDKNGSVFEFEDGIILATNGVQYAPGPGNSDEGGGNGFAWLGDDDLEDILNQNGQFNGSNNASVLEFDFIPVTDTISFDFIFASNEYGAFQCSFADVFAFLLTDLQTGITTNLAVVPDTNIPVSVVTIRKEEHSPEDWLTGEPECGDSNPEYFDKYYDDDPDLNGLPPRQNPINYKGMTIPMQAVSAVVPGRKYHIKLAIADYSDTSFNSAVFLRGGSFDLGTVDFGEDLTVEHNNALCEEGTYTLDSGLNPDWVEIEWYKDDVLIPDEDGPIYEVTEPGVYTVVGRYTAVEDSECQVEQSIKIEFYPTVEETLQQPEKIEYCRNSLEEFIDLTVVEEGMFSSVENKGDYSIEYYASEEDRDNKENIIEDPVNFQIPQGTIEYIYLYVLNEVTGCEGVFEFILDPVAAAVPSSPGDQQVCASYEFPSLPDNQYYYSGSGATGIEYKAGEVLDEPGQYEVYIYSISGNCYEERKYTVSVTAPVEAYELKDVVMSCENYILPELPEGSRYYTAPSEGGIELEAGYEVLLSQRIYIYTKSEEGPNHCVAESSFTVTYEECPIPKGISPNGDGLNDFLDLSVHGVMSLKIYNRYGVEVYSYGENYKDQWYGQDKSGNPLPDGTYYYVVISHGKVKTGWIQINR